MRIFSGGPWLDQFNGLHDFSEPLYVNGPGQAQLCFRRNTLRLLTLTFASNETWTYSYDGSGNLTTVTDGYGRELRFGYLSQPGQFNDGKLWRVGDQTATGLSTATPGGAMWSSPMSRKN